MSRRFGVGISCVTGAMLLTQLLLTRIFSVVLWYHLAFFVISLAFLGTSAGAVAVALVPRLAGSRVQERLAWYALGLSAAICVGLWSFLHIRFAPEALKLGTMARLVATALLIGSPFAFGGIVVALALAQYAESAGRLYFFDLIGASLACMVTVPLLALVSAPTGVLVAAAVAAIGAVLLGWPYRQTRAATLACAVGLTALVATNESTALLSIRFTKGREEAPLLYSGWNSFSRISVTAGGAKLHSWGLSDAYHGPIVPQLFLYIDAEANTPITQFTGDLDAVRYVRYDVTGLAYRLLERPRVLIVGPGGGRDMLTALSFGSPHIDAVEINPLIVDVVNRRFGDFSGHLYDHPAIHVTLDEGRSFIRRSPDAYDLIQLSLVDTWAATAAGAYALSESYLYTVEAFRDYLHHLRTGGILSVSRYIGPETHRLIAIAREAMETDGEEQAAGSLVVVNKNLINTLLIKRGAFTSSEVQTLIDTSNQLGFATVYIPGRDDLSHGPIMRQLRAKPTDSLYRMGDYDVSPTHDDRPFFFFFFSPRDLIAGARAARGQFFNNQANFILACVVGVATVATLGSVLLPLTVMRAAALTSIRGWPTIISYFACLGAGFILIEIQLLQRFILFLGKPVYSLTVVLFSLLIASGLGSYAAGKFIRAGGTRPHLVSAIALLAASLTASAYLYPMLLTHWIGLPVAVRVVLSVMLIIPVGFLMGIPFPSALQLMGERRARMVPWVFGINGAMSVFGSSASLLIAITWGFRTVTLAGAALYMAAALLMSVRHAWDLPPRCDQG